MVWVEPEGYGVRFTRSDTYPCRMIVCDEHVPCRLPLHCYGWKPPMNSPSRASMSTENSV